MRNNDDPILPDPKEDGKAGDPFYYHNLVGDLLAPRCRTLA